jgi:hypothetical protein
VPLIDRIPASELHRLWSDYVLRNRPVIITGLLKPQRGFEELLEHFSYVPISKDQTLGDVLAQVRRGERVSADSQPRLPFERAEFLTQPRAIEAMLTPEDRRLEARFGNVAFCGTRQEAALLHFDGWVAATLHYQLAGSKEWFLAAPESCAQLVPIGHRSLIDAMALSREKRVLAAQLVDGYSFIVEAGETLYFPQQWLHGTYYDAHCFSINDHIGRNLYGQFFEREVHPSLLRHCVLQRLFPQERAERHLAEFRIVHDACKSTTSASPRERATVIYDALRTVYDRLFLDTPQPPFVDALEREAIKRAIGEPTLLPPSESPFHPTKVERGRKSWTANLKLPLFDWF